ncbi:unnamed protein product [Acanthoscelides obtectus]|uniref:HTH CENPB-type domain-containing protein n=1 Tax=Acanthoscelides obtectus TaxID=200917 RepID=A0A9P0JUG6_ACAOB|nr:unnamed protein product [Acanthoscelides obtectus]CAK1621853.1 hypothetical protein AOBTE_LOCUS1172 [Acanthoscelides obtectus]
MAFQLALRNNIPNPFSREKGVAGKKWLRRFLDRHPKLAFRKPQSISSARIKGFTPENVKIFYDKKEVSVNGFRKSGIFPFNPFIVHDHDFAIHRQHEATPPPSTENDNTPDPEQITPPHHVYIGPESIIPLPSASGAYKTVSNNKPRTGSAKLITSTPYKEDLEKSVIIV